MSLINTLRLIDAMPCCLFHYRRCCLMIIDYFHWCWYWLLFTMPRLMLRCCYAAADAALFYAWCWCRLLPCFWYFSPCLFATRRYMRAAMRHALMLLRCCRRALRDACCWSIIICLMLLFFFADYFTPLIIDKRWYFSLMLMLADADDAMLICRDAAWYDAMPYCRWLLPLLLPWYDKMLRAMMLMFIISAE